MNLKSSLEELYPTSITESVSSGDYIKVVRNGNTSYFLKDGDNIIQLNGDLENLKRMTNIIESLQLYLD
jgi:hypothetical protein